MATEEYLYSGFRPGQRVRSVEGFPGTVTEVQDGPGNNTVIVRLDNGMGGGEYQEQELTPLNTTDASGHGHDASVDYPELGSILTDRPDFQASISEDEYLGRTASILKESLARTAEWTLSLPLDLAKTPDPAQSLHSTPGYTDGFTQAQQSNTREPASFDSDYRAAFAQGWADGLLIRPPAVEPPTTDSLDMGTDLDGAPRMAALETEGGVIDFIKGSPKPTKNWAGPGHNWSYDACRFRKNSRCMYPKELNKAATDLAGYAVWVPEDRGWCSRVKWEDQQKCNVYEPGPHMAGGFTDATVPWEEGGQRGGHVASVTDTVSEVSGIVREFAQTPTGTDFFADEADDLSRAYRDLPVLDPNAAGLWTELGALCVAQAESLKAGYQVIRCDNSDPYATSDEMYADIDKGIYKVTSLHSNHPVWDVDTNVAFRVVHDLTGHAPSHSDFSLLGEVIAYQNQCAQTPEHLWPVLFTEIVAQSAYANVHHLFGEQKVGLIPLTQEEIDAHVGTIMDSPDAAYDALHRSASVSAGDGFGWYFCAAWKDVRAKAKRIRAAGKIRVLSSLKHVMSCQVQGDNHVYQVEVHTVPGRYAVAAWVCGCAWAAYSWGRTGPWKKYEGRMCSHALAAVYEAQSRGMFGKVITEDEAAPAWVDKSKVKIDGDWSRDLGRYSSRSQSDNDSDNPWKIVEQMLLTGMPVVEVHQALLAQGVTQHVASSGPLRGQVGGRVKDLFFLDGKVMDKDGNPITGPICYPTYDPHEGLDFKPVANPNRTQVASKEPTMSSEEWGLWSDMPTTARKVVATEDEWGLSAELNDEPEPALPTTDGAADDDIDYKSQKPIPDAEDAKAMMKGLWPAKEQQARLWLYKQTRIPDMLTTRTSEQIWKTIGWAHPKGEEAFGGKPTKQAAVDRWKPTPLPGPGVRINGPHCQQCGSTEYEDLYRGDQGYTACCNERVVNGCRADDCHHLTDNDNAAWVTTLEAQEEWEQNQRDFAEWKRKHSSKDPHAWLMDGNGDADVAARAQEFLSKKGMKNFSAGERAQIIGEGEGSVAGNLGMLDLTGTHYQAQADLEGVTDDEMGFF